MNQNLGRIYRVVTDRCCPKCGHIINQTAIDKAIFNFDCPNCRTHKISEFQPLQFKQELKE